MSTLRRRTLLVLGGLAVAASFLLGSPAAHAAEKTGTPICIYIEP